MGDLDEYTDMRGIEVRGEWELELKRGRGRRGFNRKPKLEESVKLGFIIYKYSVKEILRMEVEDNHYTILVSGYPSS